MIHSTSETRVDDAANSEYQNIKAVFDKKLKNLSNLTIDKFKEYEMNIVHSMTNWSQEEKNKYIRTFVEPYYYYLNPDSSDIEIEVEIQKALRNNILKKANIYTHTIIDKYFNISTIDARNDDYVNFYKNMNFCLVPFYIEPNKTSSKRLLVVYIKLMKTIWPSITLLKHNIRGFPDQEIDSDDDDIKDYDKTWSYIIHLL